MKSNKIEIVALVVGLLAVIGFPSYRSVRHMLDIQRYDQLFHASDKEFYDQLLEPDPLLVRNDPTYDPRKGMVQSRRFFHSMLDAPWHVVDVDYADSRRILTVRDFFGKTFAVTVTYMQPSDYRPEDHKFIADVLYSARPEGDSVEAMADSLLKTYRARSVSIGVWQNGKQRIVERVQRSDGAPTPGSGSRYLFPLQRSLVELTATRMAKRRLFSWSDRIGARIKGLPRNGWFDSASIEDLTTTSVASTFQTIGSPQTFDRANRDRFLRYALTHPAGSMDSPQIMSDALSFLVLMEVLEQVGGRSTEALIEREAFQPLGMDSAKFDGPVARGLYVGSPTSSMSQDSFVAEGRMLKLNASDLMQYGKFVLHALNGDSEFVTPQDTKRFSLGDRRFGRFAWGGGFADEDRDRWQRYSYGVNLAVFPKRNLVVVVAIDSDYDQAFHPSIDTMRRTLAMLKVVANPKSN